MDVSKIIAQFGSYYIDSGQNVTDLYRMLYYEFATRQVFTTRMTNNTVYRASQSAIDSLIQPFQQNWTPRQSLVFTPVQIQLFQMKVDWQDYINQLNDDWLGFLGGPGIDAQSWPFVKWLMEMHLLPKIQEDIEINEIFTGVYAAPTPGIAGAPGTSMNGISSVIQDHMSNSRMVPIATGAFNADDALYYTQLETFTKGINQKYWKIPMQLCMSMANERRSLDGELKKYGTYYGHDFNNLGGRKIRNTNIEIVGLPSMTGSNRIFCSPKNNLVMAMKNPANQENFKVEGQDRLIKIWNDNYYLGVGFNIPGIVFANDQV